jgi:hypothetical protein
MAGAATDGDPGLTDRQCTHERHIRVGGGVARVVTGANLHVWGEDVLPSLLEYWHDGPAADPDWHWDWTAAEVAALPTAGPGYLRDPRWTRHTSPHDLAPSYSWRRGRNAHVR